MPEIILPIIHLNGTSRDALLDQLCEVYSALNDAMDKLRQASPNGRDYYPVPGLMDKAIEQHRRRQRVLSDLQAEIQEQVRQMEGIGS